MESLSAAFIQSSFAYSFFSLSSTTLGFLEFPQLLHTLPNPQHKKNLDLFILKRNEEYFPSPLGKSVILSFLSNYKLKTCVDYFVRTKYIFIAEKMQNIKQNIKWAWILGDSTFLQWKDRRFDAVTVFSQVSYLLTSNISQLVKCIPIIFNILI